MKKMGVLLISALTLATFGSYASQSVSAYGSTLDSAEARIAAKAKAAGASSYKITSALSRNGVYMTATLAD